MTTTKVIPKSEVLKHQTTDDLWLVHNGYVYDISDFSGRHPGGSEILLEYGANGVDIKDIMKSPNPHKHTKMAYNVLNKPQRFVGCLEGATPVVPDGTIHVNNGDVNTPTHSDTRPGFYDDQTAFCKDWAKRFGHYEEDDLVDWTKPILWQVGHLGEKYWNWVHTPVEKPVRLFYSEFCEFCSKCPWYTIPIIWFPIMFWVLSIGRYHVEHEKIPWILNHDINMNMYHFIGIFVVGTFFWSILEYSIHRWLFHADPSNTWPWLIGLHFMMHGQHHKDPLNPLRLVFPPVPASSLALPIFFFFWYSMPAGVNHALLAGICAGYISYDMTHYYLHHGQPYGSYLKELKRLHILHHFEDTSKGFGISAVAHFWDYPFGTYFKSRHDYTQYYSEHDDTYADKTKEQ